MPKRVDGNQREVVRRFRELGCSVQILSDLGKGCPDLVVGMKGQNFLIEVKNGSLPPSRQMLTPPEQHFFDTWQGQVAIVKSLEEVEAFVVSITL